ncbi:tripartite tricarboxylate transporter TctB family protein [Alkalilacustris brevis]|uniref:tripartite tricarboxylate transporter TctB family protein n=1 Tax=Alkalilacustris brevis TaxID=2026338 RepID=UPI0013901F2A|nr:tripartite tricarboxylate transporter TctB family protein [Alkalilacustris brevis]
MHEPTRQPPARQVNFNTVAALLTVAFGLALLWIIPHQVEQPPLIFGQRMIALDPALFPNLVAVGFVLVGLLYIPASLMLRERNGFRDTAPGGVRNVVASVAMMLAYSWAMTPLGFVPSSMLLILAMGLFFNWRDFAMLIVVAIAAPLIIYQVFSRLFGVYLPNVPWLG